jgi:hypothetical protein
MSLYHEIKGRNIIAATKHLLAQDVLEMRHSDGKLMSPGFKNTWQTPWVHHRLSYRNNCYIWKDIVFENIVKQVLPRESWFVPSCCQNCFKVVCRPESLKQLFSLADLQVKLDFASKAGIEIRPSVFGNYGGYFYNRGLSEGLKCYRVVRDAVRDEIGDIPVTLKRGCTEMEHGVGPSDRWEVTPAQMAFEELIEQKLVMDVPVVGQSPHAKDYVRQIWIEKAYEWGDETVLEYLDPDNPLYPPYVTYHHMADERNEILFRKF